MTKVPLCNLIVKDVDDADAEELLTSIKFAGVEIESNTDRVLGIDDILEVVIITVAGKLTEKTIENIAKAIDRWRKKRREDGQNTIGELDRPNYPPLDLATASYEEIKQWLSQKN